MYKLLLVDDEEDVREGVSHEIEWVKHGFEIVAKAENGKEALELIERLSPDVVVTDIMMPFMDGLELTREAKNLFPNIKIIILTGFDEFEYAKQALKLQVEEYVLKPFSAQELVDSILKVKLRLDGEMAQREDLKLLREHYQQSLPILKSSFLSSLIHRKLNKEEVMEKFLNYDIPLDGDEFVVSVLRVDQPEDMEIQLFAVLNIAEEIIRRRNQGFVFQSHNHVVIIFSNIKNEIGSLLPIFFRLLEEIRINIEKYLKFSVTIGVGTVINDVTSLRYSYEDGILALDYRLILGNNRIIYLGDVEQPTNEKPRFDEAKEHELIRCIKVGTNQELQEIVESLFHELHQSNISFKDYQIYFLEILTSLLKVARGLHVDIDEITGRDSLLLSQIQQFDNLQEAKLWVVDLCTKIMNSIVTDRQSTLKNLVDLAIEYIRDHFHENDISVAKVCSHLHISAGYFSFIFKKEMKTTFVTYLLNLRMERAKELLKSTELKALEIAEKVGFSDSNYFSFCFKKYYGQSPKEYRNSFTGGTG